MRRIALLGLLFCLFAVSPSRAWNCSDPLASRVAVPAGTAGSFGNGDGQLFLGTGSEGIKGQLYECKVPDPKTPKSGVKNSNTNTNTNSNQNSNTNNNSSKSDSTSSATGGNATATGGNATSNQTQGQQQGQEQSATATNGGNTLVSNNNYVAPRIPVASAFAGEAISTTGCRIATSAGGQTERLGLSLGFSRADHECEKIQAAGVFAGLGDLQAAHDIACKLKAAKDLPTCKIPYVIVAPTPIVVPVQVPPTPSQVSPPSPVAAVVTAQQEPVETAPAVGETVRITDVSCTLYRGHLGNQCLRKLDDISRQLRELPDSSLTFTVGSFDVVSQVYKYLATKGIDSKRAIPDVQQDAGTTATFTLKTMLS